MRSPSNSRTTPPAGDGGHPPPERGLAHRHHAGAAARAQHRHRGLRPARDDHADRRQVGGGRVSASAQGEQHASITQNQA